MRRKPKFKVLFTALLFLVLILAALTCCKQKSTQHVDLGGDKIYTSKEQLGGYTLIRSDVLNDDDDFRHYEFWFIIERINSPNKERKWVEVTKELFINTDEGEVFPVVVEKNNGGNK